MVEDSPPIYTNTLLSSFCSNYKCLYLWAQLKEINLLINKFIAFFPWSRINFYRYCHILKFASNDDEIRKYLKLYLRTDLDASFLDDIAYILIDLLEDDLLNIIQCILEVLSGFRLSFNSFSKITIALIHILNKINKGYVQILILQILCIEEKEKMHTNELESDERKFQDLLSIISMSIPETISEDLMIFLIEEGFYLDKGVKLINYAFIDFAVSRIMNLDNKSSLNKVINIVKFHQEKIYEFIYNKDIFPNWLISCYKSSNMLQEINKLAEKIFVTILNYKFENLDKIALFFAEVFSIELYKIIFDNAIINDLSIANQYFYILMTFCDEYILENINSFIDCMRKYQQSKEFVRLLIKSIDLKALENKISVHSVDSIDHYEKSKSQNLIGQYIRFSIRLLKLAPTNKEALNVLLNFLQLESINFFCNIYASNDFNKRKFQNYISTYLFYYILKLYYTNPSFFEEFVKVFVFKSKSFEKIAAIFTESNDEIFFHKINLSDTKAILSQFMGENKDEFIENPNHPSLILGNECISIGNNAKIFNNVLSINNECLFEILDKKNQFWSIIFEKIESLIKTYNSFEGKPGFISHVSSPTILIPKELAEILNMIVNDLQKDDWKQVYLKSIQRHQDKQQYDYEKLKKTLKNTNSLLNNPPPSRVKVRQCYDKLYRWFFMKPDNSKPLENKAKINKSVLPTNEIEFRGDFADISDDSELICSTENSQKTENNSFTIVNITSEAIFLCEIEHIKIQGSVFGKLISSNKFLEIISNGEVKPDSKEYLGSSLEYSFRKKEVHHIWKKKEISEIVLKRFMHCRNSIEIILCTGKSYFINLFKENTRNNFIKHISQWKKVKITGKNPLLEIEPYLNEWKRGNISNFEYLMILNKFSGRSNHDLSQYPIFPWVITNFDKETLDYESKEDYRNFNFPIGAQTQESRENLKDKFSEWESSSTKGIHFGSHYSNSGIALHFLLRIEPYTTQSKELQGGNFDCAERLFISMDIAWQSCKNCNGDFKELIPELFYQPFCLNSNQDIIYGITQNGVEIYHAKSSAWASSNWDFINKHKMALESSVCSKEISNWIDLIFGYKQHGTNALNAYNVFFPVTYEHLFNKIKESLTDEDIIGYYQQVYNFGQTPICIFNKKQHPKREEPSNFYLFHNFFYKNPDNDIKFIITKSDNESAGQAHAIFLSDTSLIVIKSRENRFFITKYTFKDSNDIQLTSKEYPLRFFYKCDHLWTLKSIRKYSFNFSIFPYNSNCFALYKKAFLVSGFHSSNSIFIHNLKGNLITSLSCHSALITTVCTTSENIFTGSIDSSIMSWKADEKMNCCLYKNFIGHTNSIVSLKAIESYCVLVSSSINGIILIFDIRTGECLKKINENCTVLDVSELGIIAVGYKYEIKYFGFNGEIISRHTSNEKIVNIKFNYFGDFCLEIYETNLIITESTDPRKKIPLPFGNIIDIVIHPLEKYLYCCKNITQQSTAVQVITTLSKTFMKEYQKQMMDLL